MRAFVVSALSVIAVGVMLVAYGLLSPGRDAAVLAADGRSDSMFSTRAVPAAQRWLTGDDGVMSAMPGWQLRCEPGQRALVRQGVNGAVAECMDSDRDIDRGMPVPSAIRTSDVRQIRTVDTYQAPKRVVKASNSRDWTKTALMIGGSTAAGAGIGGIVGGKKGALIGAAIGGGASTLFETTRR